MLLASLLVTTLLAGTPTYSANRIAFDSHSLLIDGKPTFIYSGAFHYFRCPKELWRDRFRTIKAAGMNAVETYIAWNWHERTQPTSVTDYSKMDLTDFKDWLKMAHDEFGLYTIVRPGPYICAEWANGGYPRWLMPLRPASVPFGQWLRGDDATYLAWSKHWYDAVCKVVTPEQISKKKPGQKGVILFQIENEYDYCGSANDQQRKNQLKALYDDARNGGIDVPIIGCWTHEIRQKAVPGMVGVFDSPNLYSRHDIAGAGGQVDSVKREQKDAPGMVTELQGGWFSGVGGQLSEDQSGIGANQIRAITLECIARGATILNYYMFFGGTHIGDWGARGMTTSYDYFAPIREWGAVGDKYSEVQAIAKMLAQYGPVIAVSNRVDPKVSGAPADVHVIVREGPKGERFVFLRNSSERESREGTADIALTDGTNLKVPFTLKAFGTDVVLVSKSGSLKSICVAQPQPTRPQTPPAIRIEKAWTRQDNGPVKWQKRSPRQPLKDTLEQATPFTVYRETSFAIPATSDMGQSLVVDQFGEDTCLFMVDGKWVGSNDQNGRRISFDVSREMKDGKHELLLLHEDSGNPNGGSGMEDLNGIDRAFIANGSTTIPVIDWRVKLATAEEAPSMAVSGLDDNSWDRVVLDAETLASLSSDSLKWPAARLLFGKRAGAMFRTRIELTQKQIDAGLTTLSFDRIDDHGTVWVNGEKVGRHDHWDQPYEVDVKSFLKAGTNTVAVYVVNDEGDGGLTKPVRLTHGVLSGIPVAFTEFGKLRGVQEGWMKPALPLSDWASEKLDATTPIARKGGEMPHSARESLATWTRTEFSLPATKKGVWIPWRLLVRASGNGELFVNGHSIGRYWEVGPQREFFLPECWLQFGQDKKNVLTFCLRPTDNGAKVDALEVSPYPDSAEFRS